MTILVENHHGFLIVEHDPMLYEDVKEMVEHVVQADRVFCFHEMPRAPAKGRAKAEPKVPGARATLELMDVGYQGLGWQVDEYSRMRAAKSLAVTVQSRLAGANVAREMERAMGLDAGD
jgi:hypothetical protein